MSVQQTSALTTATRMPRPLASALVLALACGVPSWASEPEPDGAGFVSLFDGETLSGWSGDEPYWSVRDGAILGEITAETLIDSNRFLIYQGTVPDDFELVAEFRVSPLGNSGINYRSEVVPDTDFHALRGYQCDIDGRNHYTGSNYEERLRTTLAGVGESVVVLAVGADDKASVKDNRWSAVVRQESLGAPADLLEGVSSNRWNEVRIVARGNVLEHSINGRLTSRVVDDDPANRRPSGRLGVQVHVGPPMTIEYRHLRLRELK